MQASCLHVRGKREDKEDWCCCPGLPSPASFWEVKYIQLTIMVRTRFLQASNPQTLIAKTINALSEEYYKT